MNINNLYLYINNIIKNNIVSSNNIKLIEVKKYYINGYLYFDSTTNKFNLNNQLNSSIRLYCIHNNTNNNNKKNILLYSGYNNNDNNSINILKHLIDIIFNPLDNKQCNNTKEILLLNNILCLINIYFIIIGSPRHYLLNINHNINHNFEPLIDFINIFNNSIFPIKQISSNGLCQLIALPIELKYFNITNNLYFYNLINDSNYNYDYYKINYFQNNKENCDNNSKPEYCKEIDILFNIIKDYNICHLIILDDKEINKIYTNIAINKTINKHKDEKQNENGCDQSLNILLNDFDILFINQSNIFTDDNKYFLCNTNTLFEKKFKIKKTIISSNNFNDLNSKVLMILYLIILNYIEN